MVLLQNVEAAERKGSRMRSISYLTLVFVSLTIEFVPSAYGQTIKASQKVEILVVDAGYDYPKVRFPTLVIESNGVYTRDGKEITDRELTTILRSTKTVGNTTSAYVRILSSQEGNVSIQTLGKSL